MKNKVKLIEQEIPISLVENIWPRIQCYLENYHNSNLIESRVFNWPNNKPVTLKQLCISCYTQGLIDRGEIDQNIIG